MFSAHRFSEISRDQSLFTHSGQRKYLNADERARFAMAARKMEIGSCSFCLFLLQSGCRISEALNLTPEGVLFEEGVVLIRSLKKRNQMVVRQVPVPRRLLALLNLNTDPEEGHRIWNWQRTWAWMQVKEVMHKSDIMGPHATPRGLRHGFGVHAIQSGVPLDMVQRWLGHSDIATTSIYTAAVGPEERALAERMWQRR
ncbi:MAG: site-specific integrase [Pseudomonadota bacterium]